MRFGTFEFDFQSGELRSHGRKVVLQSQPAQALAFLLTHPGEVVTREDLRHAIWSEDTFVDFDAAVNVAINKIRQSLNDSASAPRFVETLPKRGYRFLADVHSLVDTTAPLPNTEAPRNTGPRVTHPRRWRWAAAILATVALAAVLGAMRRESVPAVARSVAVLPFRPLVASTGDEALEVGLAEAVIIGLGDLKQLRVPSIYAVQRYARTGIDAREAGRKLGVDAVLEGNVLRQNGAVRLSARLLAVADGSTLWARQWDLPWTDIFSVQDSMAAEVTRALALSLGAGERASVRTRPTNVAAYDSYLRARHLLRRRTVRDSRRAIELLEDTVKLDPASGAAHASMAFAYISVPLLEGPTLPFMTLGRRAALRAIELDPTLAEPHSVLGRISIHYDWDAEGADRESRRALALEPENPFVLHCYSLILADEGHFDKSLTLANRALALDPTSMVANRDKAAILYLARRYEDGIQQAQRTLELDPHDWATHFWLARSYERLGREDDAIEAYLRPLTFSEANREHLTSLRAAADTGGLKGFWKQRLRLLLAEPEPRARSIATAYTQIGEPDRAFEWLEKLYADRSAQLQTLKVNSDWDPLRGDPRFDALLRRINANPDVLQKLSRAPVKERPGSH